jgi:PAS domain S-box-containing protein
MPPNHTANDNHGATLLTRQLENFTLLVEHSTDIAALIDAQAVIRYISPAVTPLLGYQPEELTDRSALDYIHPGDFPGATAAILHAVLHPEAVIAREFRFRHKQGHWLPLEITGRNLPDTHGLPRLIISARDISARWHAQEAARQAEQQFRLIFENSPDAMFVEDLNGRVLDVNPAACTLHGLARDQLIGKSILELVPVTEIPKVLEDFPRFVSGKSTKLESLSLRADGQCVSVEITASRLVYQNQPAVLLNLRDISDRKQAEADRAKLEADLRQAQKLESIGQLTAGIAHDFNNILTLIQGHAQLALSHGTLPEPVQRSLQRIAQATQHAAQLTRQLLAFSRKQPIHSQRLDLNQTIAGFMDMITRVLGRHITLEFLPVAKPAWLDADPALIEQALLNLVVNARDAMPRGGQMTIRLDHQTIGTERAEHSAANPGHHLLLSVTDTGHGIPADVLPHIFEPFYTTKPKDVGTGLGLSTVYGIAKQHGGWVEVASKLGEGSTFKLYLPAAAGGDTEHLRRSTEANQATQPNTQPA